MGLIKQIIKVVDLLVNIEERMSSMETRFQAIEISIARIEGKLEAKTEAVAV